jgi:alkaline phosphatase D
MWRMVDRRSIIRSGAWLGLTYPAQFAAPLVAAPKFATNPFASGIASGDPTSNGVVLWTRLLGEGDWNRESVDVRWELASNESFTKDVKRGKTRATPDLGHSVHVEVNGLKAGREYWYRFMVDGAESPKGRTKTAMSGPADRIRFAFASCQHFETGYYTAYSHLVKEDLDLVVHLGDYIYEGRRGAQAPTRVRYHTGDEIVSLTDYRNRYALYRTDAHLQEAHRLFPWIVTWDDHEVDNNYAGDVPEDKQTRTAFLERRANAYQAYYENMPLRRSSLPKGSHLQLFRKLDFGPLASFHVVDTRQYRSDQPCNDGTKPACPAVFDENATMFGAEQEKWLMDGLSNSRAKWNVIANQVMMAKIDRDPGPGESLPLDQWSGYEAPRVRMMKYLEERKPLNPVVITGDVHSNWVCDLRADFRNTKDPVVGTEFVGTSITSGGDGVEVSPTVAAYLKDNPHVKFFNGQRGYVSCTMTPAKFVADYKILDKVTEKDRPIKTRVSYVVEDGRPGAVKA